MAGPKPKFKDEYVEQARKLALLGLTDVEMADVFGIVESTFYLWLKKYPQLSEAIKKGKKVADANVAASLYERACGYSHPDTKFFQHDGIAWGEEYEKHYPPDTAAAFIWLKNRQPKLWRDKEEAEQGDYKPPTININVSPSKGTSDEDDLM